MSVNERKRKKGSDEDEVVEDSLQAELDTEQQQAAPAEQQAAPAEQQRQVALEQAAPAEQQQAALQAAPAEQHTTNDGDTALLEHNRHRPRNNHWRGISHGEGCACNGRLSKQVCGVIRARELPLLLTSCYSPSLITHHSPLTTHLLTVIY